MHIPDPFPCPWGVLGIVTLVSMQHAVKHLEGGIGSTSGTATVEYIGFYSTKKVLYVHTNTFCEPPVLAVATGKRQHRPRDRPARGLLLMLAAVSRVGTGHEYCWGWC